MRKTLHRFITKLNNDSIYLLHADMWGFETKGNVINCGIQEPTMVNIASGLASQGKKVIIYGVAGFGQPGATDRFRLAAKWSSTLGMTSP